MLTNIETVLPCLEKQFKYLKDEYSELYDYTPISFFTLDEDCIIQRTNLCGAKLLKINRKLLINKSFLNFIPVDSSIIFKSRLTNIIKTKMNDRFESELLQMKNKRLNIHFEGVYLESGLVLLVVINITKEKRFETSLMESEKKFTYSRAYFKVRQMQWQR